MGIINCEKIALHYGTKEILNDITLNINPGSKVGVIGVNGAGKSSLLNIITGKCHATQGSVRISPSAKLGVHSQHSDNVSDVYSVMLNALICADVLSPSEKAALRAKEDLSDVCFSLLTERFKAAGDYNL
ncbi:MAG TPA: ATP-binding cassette domain-containing protein, partial [Bacillota bacterium]|nr:ATP-binding cassette domain-containing protein [Bacillota bacterium]